MNLEADQTSSPLRLVTGMASDLGRWRNDAITEFTDSHEDSEVGHSTRKGSDLNKTGAESLCHELSSDNL